MGKKDEYQYTTIQISKEINKHIRGFCTKHGMIASAMTEILWSKHISSSMSGSISI